MIKPTAGLTTSIDATYKINGYYGIPNPSNLINSTTATGVILMAII